MAEDFFRSRLDETHEKLKPFERHSWYFESMELESMSLVELKCFVYDSSIALTDLQQKIQQANQVIQLRKTVKESPDVAISLPVAS